MNICYYHFLSLNILSVSYLDVEIQKMSTVDPHVHAVTQRRNTQNDILIIAHIPKYIQDDAHG